jgi:hypothetical protein
MKKFNKNVNVEMSVDSITQLFLNSQAVGFANAETFIETIVGTAIEKGTLGVIIAGFMGVTPKCKHPINTHVICSGFCYDYNTPESIENNDSVRRVVGNAIIIDADPYARECYLIQYWKTNSKGAEYQYTEWVREDLLETYNPAI